MVGSNDVPVAINVVFCKQTIRALRSRVCINQLELDESYMYINELAEEFTAILRGQIVSDFLLSLLLELYDVECKPIKLLS